MEHRVSYTVIGAFVLILGGVLVAGLLWLASGGATTNYNTYALYLKSGAAALNRDSPVLYHGVSVGRVASITLDPENPTRARILLAIREPVAIKVDTSAAVQTRGVTGSGYINLTGGSPKSPPLTAKPGEPYPVIPARGGGMESLTETAEEVAQRIMKLTDRLDQVLSEKNVKALSDSLQNIREVTSNLAQRSKQLSSVIVHLDSTMANADAASAKLPALVGQIHATVASIHRVVDKVGDAATGVNQTTTSLRQLAPQASSLLQQLSQASNSLDALLQELGRQPSVLILGKQQQPGPGEKGAGGSGGR